MPEIQKLNKNKFDKKAGMEYMEVLRDGNTPSLLITASLFLLVIDKLNETIDYVNSMRLEMAGLRQDVGTAIIKMPSKKKGGKSGRV